MAFGTLDFRAGFVHASSMASESEPSNATYQKIGALCVAWAYLEMQTEKAMRGLLALTEPQTKMFVWGIKVTDRCARLKEAAKGKITGDELRDFNLLCTQISQTADERNVIVHGLVHAAVKRPSSIPNDGVLSAHNKLPEEIIAQVPCWTVFQGTGKGKNYPISTTAVETVLSKIQTLADRLRKFNTAHQFNYNPSVGDQIEANWPSPL
jgi:hypothetical protein